MQSQRGPELRHRGSEQDRAEAGPDFQGAWKVSKFLFIFRLIWKDELKKIPGQLLIWRRE